MADRFRQTFNKNTLEYIIIIYSVISKRVVAQCFGVLRRRFIRPPSKLHHINVSFCDYIVGYIRFEKMVDGLTVQSYCAVLLKVVQLPFQGSAIVESGGGGALHKEV